MMAVGTFAAVSPTTAAPAAAASNCTAPKWDVHPDLISTGTPPGVGMGCKPQPRYLRPGDEMRLGIAGLGEQRQRVHAWDPQLIDEPPVRP